MKYIFGLVAFCLIIFGICYFYQDYTYKYLKAIFGMGDYKIVRDDLNSSWTPLVKNSQVKFKTKNQVYADRYSFEFITQPAPEFEPPATLTLTTTNSIKTAHLTTLKIAARASKMDSDLTIQLLGSDFTPAGKAVRLSSFGRSIYSDEWQLYRIPLAAFNFDKPDLSGLIISSDTPGVTYYLDNLELLEF